MDKREMISKEKVIGYLKKAYEKGRNYVSLKIPPDIDNRVSYDYRFETASYEDHTKKHTISRLCELVDSFFIEHMRNVKNRRTLLDIGTGDGTRIINNYSDLAERIYGIDESESGIKAAIDNKKMSDKFKFSVGTFESARGSYDIITSLFSVFSIVHEEDIEARFRQVYNLLNEGGFFYFDVMGVKRYDKDKDGKEFKYYAYMLEDSKNKLLIGKDENPIVCWAMHFTENQIKIAERVGFKIKAYDSFYLKDTSKEELELNSKINTEEQERLENNYFSHHLVILQK